MRINKKYKGVIVPMITPVDESLSIDKEAVSVLINSFVEAGVDPFILGTTGESFSVSEKDKDELVVTAAESLKGRAILYAGISGNCLSESIDNAQRYNELGANVLVAHQPFYFPMNNDQLLKYFETLADSVPCPLILYNNPITTKQSIPLEIVDRLSYHSNIFGFKDSERGIDRLDQAILLWKDREDFSHLLGWAAQSAYALLKGSDGIVPSTGNLTPYLYAELYKKTLVGDESAAYKLQDKTNAISEIYQKDRTINQSIPALKAMLEIEGICKRYALPPMFSTGDEEILEIKSAMIKMAVVS